MYLYFPIELTITASNQSVIFEDDVTAMIQTKTAGYCSNNAKIRINYDYADGYVFFIEHPSELIDYIKQHFSNKGLSAANIVTIITGVCSSYKIVEVEQLLRNAWYRLHVSHHIVIINECKVRCELFCLF